MAIYHVNPDTGDAGECRAKNGKCPFGSEDEHFTSAQAARKAFEATQTPFDLAALKFQRLAPNWAGKLPADVENAIVAKATEMMDFNAKVESGEIETKYADISNFLSIPAHPLRGRGAWFTKADDLESELGIKAKDGEYLIVLHSRQGGGNRECYCDDDEEHESYCLAVNNEELESHPQFVGYQDDDFDSTYTNHYFRGGWTNADREKLSEQGELSRKYENYRNALEELGNGDVPPWAILDPRGATTILRERDSNRAERVRVDQRVAEKFRIRKIAQDASSVLGKGGEISEADLTEIYNLTQNYYFLNSANQDSKNYVKFKEKLRATNAMMSQAQALPAGELREYLLKDRGTSSYETTEGTGRKKMKVTKTYELGSRLGSELKSVERDFERAETAIKKHREVLAKLVKNQDPTDDVKRQLELDKNLKNLWGAGWPGKPEDLPPMPGRF